jgi:hypothetical protein
MSPKAVKVYFGDEVRRVGAEHLTQQWDTFVIRLQDLLGRNLGLELKGQNGYCVRYQDDELDWINMNTTEELEEAFRTPGDVLKIVVGKVEKDEERDDLPPILPLPVPTPTPVPTPPEQEKAPEPLPEPEADPEISYNDMNSRAVNLMNQQQFEAARELLKSAITKFPTIHVFHYNLACVNSLMGSLDEAVENLNDAVTLGYSRLGHMLMDSDLENIRSHPGFKALAESMALRCNKGPFANLGRLATQVALSLWPNNAYVLFNAAKAEAAENPERAAEFLARAVAAGMNDAQAIIEEPAFRGLLILPVFQTILNGLFETPRGDSQSSPSPTETETQAAQPEAALPVQDIPSMVPSQCPAPVQVSPPTPTIQRPSPDITTFPSVTLPTQTPVPSSQPTPVSTLYSNASIYPEPVLPIDSDSSESSLSLDSTPSTPLEAVPAQTSFEPEQRPQLESEQLPPPQINATEAREQPVQDVVDEEHGVDAGYKYYEQVATLWGMGFFDVPRLRELLEKHNGNVSRVVFDLI